MKKYIYTLLAIVSMLATSCSNEEIEIEVTAPQKKLNLSIATSKAYETFGISDYVNALGEIPNLYIGVTSLLYDSEGNLVDEVNSNVKQFGPVNQTFSVSRGKYTLLTVMTFAEKQNYTYSPVMWEFVNKNKLSTARLEKKDQRNISYLWVVSMASEEITMANENKSIAISPQLLGSMVNIEHYNFDKKEDVGLVFAAKNISSGINLDPKLKGNDRYYYKKYNDEDHSDILWLFYNEKTHKLDSEGKTTMYLLEEATLPIQFGFTNSKKITNESISWLHYPEVYHKFNAGQWYRAAYYYIGGETDESDANYARYLDDFSNFSGFNEWYNNAQAAYEENLNNNEQGGTSNGRWKSLGTGTYTDGILAPFFGLEPVTYNVQIMEHIDSAGLYRIMNPYSNSVYPYADGDCAEEGTYLLVNACDPDAVFIPEQSLGMDWGYGTMSFISVGARYLDQNSFETVKSAGYFGTKENGVITLPTFTTESTEGKTIYFQGIMYMGSDGYYCGMKNGFRITLPKDTRANYSKFVCDLEKSVDVSKWEPEMISPLQNIKKQKSPKKIIKEIRLDSSRRMQE